MKFKRFCELIRSRVLHLLLLQNIFLLLSDDFCLLFLKKIDFGFS